MDIFTKFLVGVNVFSATLTLCIIAATIKEWLDDRANKKIIKKSIQNGCSVFFLSNASESRLSETKKRRRII